MTFSRIRAFGAWNDGSTLLASEMEEIDTRLSNALDGDQGGVYAPATALIIGGAGLRLTAGLIIDAGGLLINADGAQIRGDVLLLNGFRSHGAAQFDSTIAAQGLATFTGGATFNSGVLFGAGQLAEFSGSAIFQGTVLFESTTVATFQGAASFSNGFSSAGVIAFSGTGRIRDRESFAPNSNATVLPGGIYVISGAAGAITTSNVYTIDTSTAQIGDRVEFRNFSTHTHTVGGIAIPPTLAIYDVVTGIPGGALCEFLDDGSGTGRWVKV